MNQLGLHTDYSLSRRTDIYAQVVYQFASGMNTAIYNGDTTLTSSDDSAAAAARYQTAVTVGLRQKLQVSRKYPTDAFGINSKPCGWKHPTVFFYVPNDRIERAMSARQKKARQKLAR
ncbi:hypothetical protein [Paraburkholderia heleia]|uniref:hypothetical protein n=1 Tax=Paraburkholderia heleia TaxID=634127 RepID=UPI002AB60896|nr:hypothetical protein [Paraburkholderia heleia]